MGLTLKRKFVLNQLIKVIFVVIRLILRTNVHHCETNFYVSLEILLIEDSKDVKFNVEKGL